jgi:hypothetical protein
MRHSMPGHRRHPSLCAALAVFLLTGFALTLTRQPQRIALPRAKAVAAVMRDGQAARDLRRSGWDDATADALDGRLERVSFYAHGRIVFEAAVDRSGTVAHAYQFAGQAVPYGNPLAFEPSVLIGLGVLFALMTAVAPVRRMRNLDVAALLSFLAPVVLLQKRYVDASVIAAAPGMSYLAVRCACVAFGSRRAPPASTPVYLKLTARWREAERVRVLRLTLVSLGLVFVMVGVSSPGAVDVAYALMEGATKLLHGVIPYGHMPGDVVHGDTYPILSYLLYVPLAAISPVASTWDSVDLALGAAVLAALSAAGAAFCLAAGPRRHGRRRSAAAETHGLRTAIAWLSFPPLLIAVSTGTSDVVLGAMLVFAIVLWRAPAASAAMLAAAGWFKLAPFALVPLWLAPLRGRRLVASAVAIAGVSTAMLAVVVGVGGPSGLAMMWHALAYQFQRGSPQSPWAALGISAVQPIGQATVLALIAGGCVRLRLDPGLATRERMSALAAAVLLGLQLAADYWAFLYLAWIVPLIALSVLADGEPDVAVQPAAPDRRPATPLLATVPGQ